MPEQVEIPFGRDFFQLLEKMNGISHGDKEVFLWELVSNATRALFKMRVESLYDNDMIGDPRGFFIDIIPNKIDQTLSIVDNGIGMTEDCLKKALFTIPEISLEKYNDTIDKLVKKKKKIDVNEFYTLDSDVGLGFFAAYMVADSVHITTKHYRGDKQCTLFSSPKVNPVFFVESCTATSSPRGTKVTLQLNKDHLEYLDECRLKVLIDKYTFAMCPYPISIRVHPQVNNIIQRVADVEEKNKDLKLMETKFKGLLKLFKKVIRKKFGGRVKSFIVSDRIYDLSSNLSLDYKTLEINPRSWLMEKLRDDAERNPDDEEVVGMIYGQYVACKGNITRYEHKTSDYPFLWNEGRR